MTKPVVDNPGVSSSDSMVGRRVVYLAARYSRKDEMRVYAGLLDGDDVGCVVRAEWIDGTHDGTPDEECARIDYAEVAAADVVISFAEGPGAVKGRGRGGRHVEFGIALALGKRCIVIGWRENVFHHLPQVEFYESFGECVHVLATEVTA